MPRRSSDRISRFAQAPGTLVPDATSPSVILLLIFALLWFVLGVALVTFVPPG